MDFANKKVVNDRLKQMSLAAERAEKQKKEAELKRYRSNVMTIQNELNSLKREQFRLNSELAQLRLKLHSKEFSPDDLENKMRKNEDDLNKLTFDLNQKTDEFKKEEERFIKLKASFESESRDLSIKINKIKQEISKERAGTMHAKSKENSFEAQVQTYEKRLSVNAGSTKTLEGEMIQLKNKITALENELR